MRDRLEQYVERVEALFVSLERMGKRMTDQITQLDSEISSIEGLATRLQSVATNVEGIISDLQKKADAAKGEDIGPELKRLAAVNTQLQSAADALGSETETPAAPTNTTAGSTPPTTPPATPPTTPPATPPATGTDATGTDTAPTTGSDTSLPATGTDQPTQAGVVGDQLPPVTEPAPATDTPPATERAAAG